MFYTIYHTGLGCNNFDGLLIEQYPPEYIIIDLIYAYFYAILNETILGVTADIKREKGD